MKFYSMALGLDVCILVVDGKNNEYNTEGMKKNLSGFYFLLHVCDCSSKL